jgi:hypothetical protein
LALFMTRVRANDANHTFASDYFTLFTHTFY